MDISDARKMIDEIDGEMAELFEKRMNLSAEIAQYKIKNNLPVFDGKREEEIIKNLCSKTDKSFEKYLTGFYEEIFRISRSYQNKIINKTED